MSSLHGYAKDLVEAIEKASSLPSWVSSLRGVRTPPRQLVNSMATKEATKTSKKKSAKKKAEAGAPVQRRAAGAGRPKKTTEKVKRIKSKPMDKALQRIRHSSVF